MKPFFSLSIALSVLSICQFAHADRWSPIFSTLSPDQSHKSLVLILITNDDPFDGPQSLTSQWCGTIVDREYQSLCRSRPFLDQRVVLQHAAIGMPAVLRGGSKENHPAKAMVAITDRAYRLLAFIVGVPSSSELAALIDDAEDVLRWRTDHGNDHEKVVAAANERAKSRINRQWHSGIESVQIQLSVSNFSFQVQSGSIEARNKRRFQLSALFSTLHPIYLTDAALRFGLRNQSDHTRLAVLEQHPQTRQPWCESVVPFVLDLPFRDHWRQLVEAVWNSPTISPDESADELLQWWATLQDDQPVALTLRGARPATLSANVNDLEATKGSWEELSVLLDEAGNRTITTGELAVLLRSLDIPPVNLQEPSYTRYVFFEKPSRRPLLMREGDSPARYIGMLKRVYD